MLCRNCLRTAIARQSVSSAPLRSSSPSLRASHQISRSIPGSTTRGLPLLASRSAAVSGRRTYSTSTAAEPQASTHESAASTTASSLEKPDFLDEAESTIWDRLVKEFDPKELVVQDISGGCGSMYGIEISSEKFRGASMLKQQRMVNAVLGDLMKGWHGVQLKTRVP